MDEAYIDTNTGTRYARGSLSADMLNAMHEALTHRLTDVQWRQGKAPVGSTLRQSLARQHEVLRDTRRRIATLLALALATEEEK